MELVIWHNYQLSFLDHKVTIGNVPSCLPLFFWEGNPRAVNLRGRHLLALEDQLAELKADSAVVDDEGHLTCSRINVSLIHTHKHVFQLLQTPPILSLKSSATTPNHPRPSIPSSREKSVL